VARRSCASCASASEWPVWQRRRYEVEPTDRIVLVVTTRPTKGAKKDKRWDLSGLTQCLSNAFDAAGIKEGEDVWWWIEIVDGE